MSIRKQCQALEVHRSNVYYCQKQSDENNVLSTQIQAMHEQYPYYGYRKIHHCLKEQGSKYNRKRVLRVMKERGIPAVYARPRTSLANTTDTVYPYLLKELEINKANQVWAVDITYIRLPAGMVYLFALIDWHSRYVVAHRLVNTMQAQHGVQALEEGLGKYGRPEICNADPGAQFTGQEWISTLKNYTIKISHDGKGRCIDNVRIERLFRTIKYEEVYLNSYERLPEARERIRGFIEHYNNKRPHQALGYKTPAQVYLAKAQN